MGLSDEFLRKWDRKEAVREPLQRLRSSYDPMDSFELPKGDEKQYMQQFGDMYFLRLARLKPVVEAIAMQEWDEFEIAGERAQRVERVLDVRQGQLCWVAGTVYIDLPLKPNILDDISREHWVAGPPPRHSYFSHDRQGETQVMLEDESGRLRLTGAMLRENVFVTGVILAVLGTENANGEFEVLEMHLPNLPKQPARWERQDEEEEDNDQNMKTDRKEGSGKKVALISGLDISGSETDQYSIEMLSEFLLGEAFGQDEAKAAGSISRLVIAGNSVSDDLITGPQLNGQEGTKKATSKKYGYDASAYNPIPTTHLDHFLAGLLPSMPITIMPGEFDPANTSLPQQKIHSAMFPHARAYSSPDEDVEAGWFDSVSNPWEGDIEGWRFLGHSGQPIDDVLKYVNAGGPDGLDQEGRLEALEQCLKWRCIAPTAPDTLWCYPFQEKDQFVIEECPHVFFVGNQPKFETTMIDGPVGQQVCLITIPSFHETGQVVLLDTETLECELVKIDIDKIVDDNNDDEDMEDS